MTNIKKYGNFILKTRKKAVKGAIKMLNDEICKLRDKLNKSIENGDDYEIIYKLSTELDELISKYYWEKGTVPNSQN